MNHNLCTWQGCIGAQVHVRMDERGGSRMADLCSTHIQALNTVIESKDRAKIDQAWGLAMHKWLLEHYYQ